MSLDHLTPEQWSLAILAFFTLVSVLAEVAVNTWRIHQYKQKPKGRHAGEDSESESDLDPDYWPNSITKLGLTLGWVVAGIQYWIATDVVGSQSVSTIINP